MRFLAVPLSWARRPTVIEGKVVERLEGMAAGPRRVAHVRQG